MADPASKHPREHARFPYVPIVERKPLKWPKEARIAVWVVPNIEHFGFDRRAISIADATAHLVPDVLNYSWRDYGVRVGIWRLMDVMERYGIVGTVALNSDVCRLYPQIIEAGRKLGWEFMGHGTNNTTRLSGLSTDDERSVIREVTDTITASTGTRPRGWLSPGLSETYQTLDLLNEAGFLYVCDWVNDEQPYLMNVAGGSILSMPYSAEINDLVAFLILKQTPEQFAQMICDQFDVLYSEGATSGRVMAIALHPLLIGHPYRIKHLAKAFAHITSHSDVWLATGSEIANWYLTGQSG